MDPASITLTVDELLVFLTMVGCVPVNSLDTGESIAASQEELDQRLTDAESLLRERGLVSEQEEELILDDVLVALVGGFAIPDATFVLTQAQQEGEPVSFYFHATPDLLIEQHAPEAGSYEFTHIPNSEILSLRIETLLAPLHSFPAPDSGKEQVISNAALSQFVEHYEGQDPESAMKELTDAGWPAEIGAAFSGDYALFPRWIGVTTWGLRKPEPATVETVMAVMGADRCWLIQNVDEPVESSRIRLASGAECEHAFLRLVQPLQKSVTSAE